MPDPADLARFLPIIAKMHESKDEKYYDVIHIRDWSNSMGVGALLW